ncbi:MAG: hypothetical protein AB7O57_08620 [Hyphomicrobiaceae bacterium]
MSRKTVVIAAAGLLAVAGTFAAVYAQGHRGGWHGHGHGMMGDEDGGHGMRGHFGRAMSKDDFDARVRERFARLDRNSDNIVDASEVEAALGERMSQRMGKHFGRGGGEPGERMLKRMGAGADGKVTKEQFRTEIGRRFAEADLTSDGRIDDVDLPPMMRGRNVLAESGPGRGGPMLRWLRMLGVQPKDGAILREDVLAAADRQFDRMDRNKDGTLDKTDTDAMRKEMVDYRVKRFIHHYGGDKDGRVTREQFQAKATERFARMDVDNDGAISRDERPGGGWGHGHRRGHGQMGPHHGGRGMGDGMMGPGGMGGAGSSGEPPTRN